MATSTSASAATTMVTVEVVHVVIAILAILLVLLLLVATANATIVEDLKNVIIPPLAGVVVILVKINDLTLLIRLRLATGAVVLVFLLGIELLLAFENDLDLLHFHRSPGPFT